MVLVAADVMGAPCWLSLATRDRPAAERFYGAVLGWTFRQGRFGRAFSVAEVDGVPVAGIGAVAAEFAVPVAWTPYFAVDDADEVVTRVRERGGTLAVGPVSYPPGGRAALAADPHGAAFGVWDGDVLAEWSVSLPRSPAWLELLTVDAFDAAIFYGEAMGWGQEATNGCCDVSYEDDQVVVRRHGEPVARLNSGPVEEGAPKPQLRPRWLVHFRVPNLERAVALALENGGGTVTGAEWGGGQQAALRDPDGGLFTLDQSSDAPALGARHSLSG
ncbi:VOC family protein [Streptomyces sp. NPDC096193]|uniref:VOC family protein n=1 Tax=Streptomyces sp. NPDC096193 TaxID=3155821 RepID=UPI003323D4E0